MSSELEKVKKLFADLMRRPTQVFPQRNGRLQAPTKQGVYVILAPNGRVEHVGRTLRGQGGLAQRLRNHLHGQSSFTEHHLAGDGSKLRARYQFRYLEVDDPRKRALLEAYAIAHLCPTYLGLGEDVS